MRKKKKTLYMAIVKLDTPVLLITDRVWNTRDDGDYYAKKCQPIKFKKVK